MGVPVFDVGYIWAVRDRFRGWDVEVGVETVNFDFVGLMTVCGVNGD